MVLRLGALGLAALLWVFVVSDNQYTMVLEIPIEARNLSTKKALKEEVPEFAQARFEGTGRALFKAMLLKDFFEDYKLVLDLNRISEEYEFILNEYFNEYPQKVVLPPSLELEYIEVVYPSEVHISLDEYLVKTVSVLPDVLVKTASGYVQVADIHVSPSTIDIAGPKELMQSIHFVHTVRDTVENLMSSIHKTIPIEKRKKIIEYSVEEVKYSVNIQAISERIITEVPVKIVNISSGYRVFVNPRTVSLTLIGGVDRISDVYPEDVFIYIDFKDKWNLKQQFYEPSVVTPNDILEWRDLSPRNVELVVTREVG
ncbi:MAG: hypothetical protein ISS10_00980 [Candidatus Marinimicrobia bacterium]|nr:hypothetical protein [Candidatus Neomarinimicrobiota bacterium]